MPDDNQFRDLIRRVRDRDESAAAELVHRYETAIRRIVRIQMRDTRMRRILDSTDICQSVLASFFVRTALGQYDLDTPDKLLHLLTSIARNKLSSQGTRHHALRRDIRRDAEMGDDAGRVPDSASDPSEQAAAKEILEKVRAGLNANDLYLADQRALGRGWKEIAKELGESDEALRKRLSRAIDQVMTEMGLGEVIDE